MTKENMDMDDHSRGDHNNILKLTIGHTNQTSEKKLKTMTSQYG